MNNTSEIPETTPADDEASPRTIDEIIALAREVVASGKQPKKEVVLSFMRDLIHQSEAHGGSSGSSGGAVSGLGELENELRIEGELLNSRHQEIELRREELEVIAEEQRSTIADIAEREQHLEERHRLLSEAEEEFGTRDAPRSMSLKERRDDLVSRGHNYLSDPPIPVAIMRTQKIYLPPEANAHYTADGAVALAAALLRCVSEIES